MNSLHLASNILGCVRVDVDKHHDFGHVIQAAGQRVRADASCQDRAVGQMFGSQSVGFQVFRHASLFTSGTCSVSMAASSVSRRPVTLGYFVLGENDFSSKSFSLHGQVHDDT